MLDALLKYVSDEKGSDLHLKVGSRPIMRRNTKLFYIGNTNTVTDEEMNKVLDALLSEYGREQLEEKFSFDLSYEIEDESRFRVNISRDGKSYLLVARVIPCDIPPMESLRLPHLLKKIVDMRDGIVLVTGATGNGKSTTVASMLNYLNKSLNKRIYTLEDPIEYRFKDEKSIVSQRELGKDIVSFDSALKYVLRQDPDIIFVGEMRDKETIKAAIRAAETGHLVISTIHTRNTSQTIDRIVDMFPKEEQGQVRVELAHLLQMIMSQQLMPSDKAKGMALAYELLICTPAVSNLIREGKTHQIQSILETGGKYGMKTFEASLDDLYKSGYISKEEMTMRINAQAIYRENE
ncbi:twitching motility protein PilT [Propionigenium maris DSM 9537]|uniref:Twitching motility protein PilT n=1 Tax=Propionigenium maris DSM 9537 TaxID=1123000 RepID=A0A9W6GP08_9FUSO|nr:PilT/PilU family type 4a pilus ATPase [Propionigenium maris]GLI57670.1 twitching motility protein PilT [Propionigenium maris DSM 9537]